MYIKRVFSGLKTKSLAPQGTPQSYLPSISSTSHVQNFLNYYRTERFKTGSIPRATCPVPCDVFLVCSSGRAALRVQEGFTRAHNYWWDRLKADGSSLGPPHVLSAAGQWDALPTSSGLWGWEFQQELELKANGQEAEFSRLWTSEPENWYSFTPTIVCLSKQSQTLARV